MDAATAIRHHYDVGNSFYRLWLDSSLTYSCAIPDGADDALDAAQDRKLQFHLDAIAAASATRVLDIGCGWGAMLKRLSDSGVERAVGLTLSDEQAAYVRSRDYRGVDVRIENWLDYEPDAHFDGIVSIGAFEHFAKPDDSVVEKVRVYRDFFDRCRGWLHEDGMMSLQTIAYANMSRDSANQFVQQDIFPNADLPTFAEIATAAEGIFEIQAVHNGRLDYAWTCEEWARRLRRHRTDAVDLVGADVVARYEHYLKLSALGFRMGKICLLRIVLRPYSDRHFR
ncbi:class I SAM-dependent methyltransferase [Rhodococcus jostii]|uniref:Cyclopropane-fatty-acyl-phospholipid synthase n=1 Tax=Rhodococcus jostii TaxID=132919 RepID=A0A1H5MI13_RHOJO|nr:class I SAM-dependent methyltransferase [Rhodococcus jostii]SEE88956.1 cyclopropane-fatty-acyl-phospholipid synthase [Rhodococcus jostii]